MSEIEKALLKATGVKPQGAKEDRQKFLVRLMVAVTKMDEEGWNALEATAGAQEWHTAAVDADNDGKDVPEFEDAEGEADVDAEAEDAEDGDDVGDDEAEEDESAEDDEEEQVEDKPKKAAKPDKGTAKKTAKAEKPAKAEKATKPAKEKAAKPTKAEKVKPEKAAKEKTTKAAPKGNSMRRTLKMIVIKEPTITVESLITKLEAKGYKSPSKLTVTSIRSDTRDTIRVLNDAGKTNIQL